MTLLNKQKRKLSELLNSKYWESAQHVHRVSLYEIYITFAEGKTSPLNECPGLDTKQSDSEVPVMLELWGMQSTPSKLYLYLTELFE